MKKKGKPVVHEELDGFNIKINEFGEMETTVPIDKLNTFLNEKVVDKKLSSEEEE
ncbi:MAG: hypothetical protein AAGA77_04080 [Bacteroidota bacterium]